MAHTNHMPPDGFDSWPHLVREYVKNHPGASTVDICEEYDIPRSNVSTTIAYLLRVGQLEEIPGCSERQVKIKEE